MQEVSDIVQKKDKVCALINDWGFHISQAESPKIYPDPYEKSGSDSLCLLVVDANSEVSPVYRRHHLLGYELAKLLGCKVSVNGLEDFTGKEAQENALADSISLLASPQEIIAHYNEQSGEHYKFSTIDLEEELTDLGFSDAQEAEEEIQQLKKMIADTTVPKPASKMPSFPFFQGPASSHISTVSADPIKSNEEECEVLLKILHSNPSAAAILKKDVDILLDLHRRLSAGNKLGDFKSAGKDRS